MEQTDRTIIFRREYLKDVLEGKCHLKVLHHDAMLHQIEQLKNECDYLESLRQPTEHIAQLTNQWSTTTEHLRLTQPTYTSNCSNSGPHRNNRSNPLHPRTRSSTSHPYSPSEKKLPWACQRCSTTGNKQHHKLVDCPRYNGCEQCGSRTHLQNRCPKIMNPLRPVSRPDSGNAR